MRYTLLCTLMILFIWVVLINKPLIEKKTNYRRLQSLLLLLVCSQWWSVFLPLFIDDHLLIGTRLTSGLRQLGSSMRDLDHPRCIACFSKLYPVLATADNVSKGFSFIRVNMSPTRLGPSPIPIFRLHKFNHNDGITCHNYSSDAGYSGSSLLVSNLQSTWISAA